MSCLTISKYTSPIQTNTSTAYLYDVEEDKEDEEGVAVDVERELPLDALLDEERVANALAALVHSSNYDMSVRMMQQQPLIFLIGDRQTYVERRRR